PGEEIVIVDDAADSLAALRGLPELRRRGIAERARAKVFAMHTGDHRALELEGYYAEAVAARRPRRRARA
ncbi:MAG: glycosyltransferase family 1 protein, partial [Acetobacteraceae bacterium]|nr:glycosyltransferase family 1 protein [Acetobacteraceae bacterium]